MRRNRLRCIWAVWIVLYGAHAARAFEKDTHADMIQAVAKGVPGASSLDEYLKERLHLVNGLEAATGGTDTVVEALMTGARDEDWYSVPAPFLDVCSVQRVTRHFHDPIGVM